MGDLEFTLEPPNIALGATTQVALGMRHDLEGTLHHLRFRVRAGPRLQVIGTSQLQIDQVEPGETIRQNLCLQGQQPGPTELCLDRITAQLGGCPLSFPAATLPLEISQAQPLSPGQEQLSRDRADETHSKTKVGRRDLHDTSAMPSTPEAAIVRSNRETISEPMNISEGKYDLQVVRELLGAAFSDEEFMTLAFDRFRPVYDDISGGMVKSEKTRRLVDWCERNLQMEKLMAEVQRRNLNQYERYAPHLKQR